MPQPYTFIDGYRLIDGTELNDKFGNPQWSIEEGVSATSGGSVGTSHKIVETITQVTSALTPGAGVTLPQALPGRVFLISNQSGSTITVFAGGDSLIDGVPGNIGITQNSNTASFYFASGVKEWQALPQLPYNFPYVYVEIVISISDLRLWSQLPGASPGQVSLIYNNSPGDGGGLFWLDAADHTSLDNGTTIIVDAVGNRWKREQVEAQYIANVPFGPVTATDVQTAVNQLSVALTSTNNLNLKRLNNFAAISSESVVAGKAIYLAGYYSSGDDGGGNFYPQFTSPVSVTSLTAPTTTASAVTATPHGLVVGNTVVIAGATPSAFNGTFIVTSSTASTFTYTIGTSGITASGTITAQKKFINDSGTVVVPTGGNGYSAWVRDIQTQLTIKMFGAVCDGIVDDAVAVQAAFTAMNGTGNTLVINGPACKIGTTISLNNYSFFTVDFQECAVNYTGGAGTYLFDMTQAGDIVFTGGSFTTSANTQSFIKTIGSAAAQATIYPPPPLDDQWTRRIYLSNMLVANFDIVLDLQNFSREIWVTNCDFSNNIYGIKIEGKVVNLHVNSTVLYSSIASSTSIYCRGNSGDPSWRYAEGLFFTNCICDVQGVAVDIQDFYLLSFTGGQIQSPVQAINVTKGICPLTRNFWFTNVLFNGNIIVGTGLLIQFIFNGTFNGVYQNIANTAIDIVNYAKNITISGQFDSPTGTPVAVNVGPDCFGVTINATIEPTYTTKIAVDPTSVATTTAQFSGTWTPALEFGGASVGLTYSATPEGFYQWTGNLLTVYFKIQLSNKGSSTGTAMISGLPFDALIDGVGSVGKYNGFNVITNPFVSIDAGTAALNVKSSGTGSEVILTDTDFSNTTVFNGYAQYIISSI